MSNELIERAQRASKLGTCSCPELLEEFIYSIKFQAAEIERLTKLNVELLTALSALRSVCFDRRKSIEEFERIGDLYYREFGRLRPGKDDPMRDSCSEENTRQYEEWSRKRTEAALDIADSAIASAKEQQ